MHSCLKECLDREKRSGNQTIEYTDTDVVGATLLYAHILSNRLIHIMIEEKTNIGISQEIANNYATFINLITMAMSRVDTSKYFKGTEK